MRLPFFFWTLVVVVGFVGSINSHDLQIPGLPANAAAEDLRGFTTQEILKTLKTLQSDQDDNEMLTSLMKDKVFLRHLPEALEEVMSFDQNNEVTMTLTGILSEFLITMDTQQFDSDKRVILTMMERDKIFQEVLPHDADEVETFDRKEELTKALTDVIMELGDGRQGQQFHAHIGELLPTLMADRGFIQDIARTLDEVMTSEQKEQLVNVLNDVLVEQGIPSSIKADQMDLQKIFTQFKNTLGINVSNIGQKVVNFPDFYIEKHIDEILHFIIDNWDAIIQWIVEHAEEYIIKLIEEHLDDIKTILLRTLNAYLQNVLSIYYLPMSDEVSDECWNATDEFFLHLGGESSNVLKMIDSWGKLPDGFLFGNLVTLGVYEECVQSETTYFRDDNETEVYYTGRYCKVSYGIPEGTNISDMGIIGKIALAHGIFGYGTCIPSVCTAEDLWTSLNQTLSNMGLTVGNIQCHAEHDGERDLSDLDKSMVSLIGLFLALVVLGTLFDCITRCYDNTKARQGFGHVIIGFSFYHNMEQIFSYEPKPGSDNITCMGAMRVLTMTWIIICDQYDIDKFFVSNFMDSLKYQDPVPAQIVTNGWLAGDTFLCLTGIVIAYRVFPCMQQNRGCAIGIFIKTFVRRFFRLAPSIMFVALFSASLLKYLAVGPISYELDDFSKECEDYWWKDSLFVNNYIFGESDGLHFRDCLTNCWYTAVDMQLLLILPILLIPIIYSTLIGWITFLVIFICSIIIPMSIIITHHLPPIPFHLLTLEEHFEYNWRVYVVPWCRAGPWLVGIATGVLLRQKGVANLKMPKFLVFCGYVLAIILGLALVMCMYPYNHVMPDEDFQDYPSMSATYGSMARPVWGICVAFVVFCCHTKNSEVVNRFLSYAGWRPLAKLTYGMYLISPVVQKWWFAGRYTLGYYNYEEKLFQSLGVTFISGLAALGLSCFVERPICTIINLILPSPAMKLETPVELFKKRDPGKKELLPIHEQEPDFKMPRILTTKVEPMESSPFGHPPHPPFNPNAFTDNNSERTTAF